MILWVNPRLAGPLAVAIAGLRKWYTPPDAEVRQELARLQAILQKVATGGHPSPTFDPAEIAAQAEYMKPYAVTYEAAGELLSTSDRTVRRLVNDGELSTIGTGSGTRVVVASIEAYVARQASRLKEAS